MEIRKMSEGVSRLGATFQWARRLSTSHFLQKPISPALRCAPTLTKACHNRRQALGQFRTVLSRHREVAPVSVAIAAPLASACKQFPHHLSTSENVHNAQPVPPARGAPADDVSQPSDLVDQAIRKTEVGRFQSCRPRGHHPHSCPLHESVNPLFLKTPDQRTPPLGCDLTQSLPRGVQMLQPWAKRSAGRSARSITAARNHLRKTKRSLPFPGYREAGLPDFPSRFDSPVEFLTPIHRPTGDRPKSVFSPDFFVERLLERKDADHAVQQFRP